MRRHPFWGTLISGTPISKDSVSPMTLFAVKPSTTMEDRASWGSLCEGLAIYKAGAFLGSAPKSKRHLRNLYQTWHSCSFAVSFHPSRAMMSLDRLR